MSNVIKVMPHQVQRVTGSVQLLSDPIYFNEKAWWFLTMCVRKAQRMERERTMREYVGIDPKVFGDKLKAEREFRGYETSFKFSLAIEQYTGNYVAPDIINKIELGEWDPRLSELISICITLADDKPYLPMATEIDIVTESMVGNVRKEQEADENCS